MCQKCGPLPPVTSEVPQTSHNHSKSSHCKTITRGAMSLSTVSHIAPLDWATVLHLTTNPSDRRRLVTRDVRIQRIMDRQTGVSGNMSGLLTNKYPYLTSPTIHHYVYWGDSWNISHDRISRLVPPNLDSCSYVNPPGMRSQPHLPHSHVFVNVPNVIPDIHHVYLNSENAEDESANNDTIIRWTPYTLEFLWSQPVMSRWSSRRHSMNDIERTHLERLGPLLYLGGSIGDVIKLRFTLMDTGVIYYGNTLLYEACTMNVTGYTMASTPFCPYIYDYMDYLTRQGYYHSNIDTISSSSYHRGLDPWEQHLMTWI